MPYKLPPSDILTAADAPPTPFALVSPRRDRVLFVEYQMHLPMEVLSRPFLKLGGARIDPKLHGRQRLIRFTGFEIFKVESGERVRLALPGHGTLGRPAEWSLDGARLAFTLDTENGIELWVGDPDTGATSRLGDHLVNDSLAPIQFGGGASKPFYWLPDGRLLVRLLSNDGSVPRTSEVPDGPRVEETAGKRSQMPTFQDLLSTPLDEDLFAFFTTAQLAIIDPSDASMLKIGEPGIYPEIDASPSGEFLMVTELKRPFSYRVPYSLFSRRVVVWDLAGELVAELADLPVSDEVPRHGVPTGPRDHEWQQNRPSSVVWTEALDEGDPTVEVPSRDRVLRVDLPSGRPQHLFDVTHRLVAWHWLEQQDEALYTEWDRDRRWRTTYLLDFSSPEKRKVMIDISVNERYDDPGWPTTWLRTDGTRTVVQDGSRIYMSGQGQTPERARPFLRTFDLFTLESSELFRCSDDAYEVFAGFVSTGRDRILVRRESPQDPPNYFVKYLTSDSPWDQVTHFSDPHPAVTGVTQQIVRYTRSDGVELSAMLYLPSGYDRSANGPIPVFVWAYPLDYSDPSTAGQVSGSDMAFTRLSGASPLWLLMRGWAVLMDAKMPVVGDPETMNDTFIEQVTDSAKAAVDALVEMGIGHPERFAVGGHSYGAFMTASLLAHTDLFAAGVARSGAYNRSLTPFGFQTERRSYWEVPEIYQRVSPFTYAHQITAPLLLIHGEEDNNTGTFPIQSERLYQAIQGNGGTSRLVMLPKESHGYLARESILHVIAETVEWLEKHVGRSGTSES